MRELGYERAWRSCMELTREIAVEEARKGRVTVTQRGAPADCARPLRGPIRVRAAVGSLATTGEDGSEDVESKTSTKRRARAREGSSAKRPRDATTSDDAARR